ncbi:MAG: hypothetical protein GXP62_11885 [Oligoflexia bacterium]|nr:hypothetical protein [Oligoflexia bacterium]
MPDNNPPPATTLDQAYRNCSPQPLPPDHGWYVDLGPAREGNLRPVLERRFRAKPGPGAGVAGQEAWPKVLFLGMRGSGKSTELNALAASLRDAFEVIRIEVDDRLNLGDFDLAELVLAVAVDVERHFREELKKPLDEGLLNEIQRWFAAVTHEEVKERLRVVETSAGVGLPKAAGFFGSVMGLLKSSNVERDKVVASLRRFPGELVTLCNRLLQAADTKLGSDRELLLVLDNLDRYPPQVVDRALGGGADHIMALHTSMVLTPPVDLLLRPLGQPLSTVYAAEVMHVPAVRKPQEPPGTLSDPGASLLRQLLGLRVDVDRLFQAGVADELIRLSGGHPRMLLDLSREAILREGGERLSLEAVAAATRAQLTLVRDQVNSSGLIDLLAQVALRQQLGDHPDYLRLLFNRWIFKHDGQDWYAVNPVVLRVPEVAAAIKAAKAAAAASDPAPAASG